MNLDWVEWVWLLLALAGLGFSVYGVLDGTRDLHALIVLDTDGDRTRVVRSAILSEALRMFVFVVFVAVGIGAILTPNRVQAFDLAILYSIGFILADLALLIQSILTYQLRRFIVRFSGGRRPQEMSRSATGKQDARDAVSEQGRDMSEGEGRIGHTVSRDPEQPRPQSEAVPPTAPTPPEPEINEKPSA